MLRRQFGVVLQNGGLEQRSIFDNIAGGSAITMEDAERAAQMAGFGEDLANLPMGLHTLVSEGGSNLSGGQRQRILLARAVAAKPRLLLLDEATSALDNRTQALVSENLDRLTITRLIIAHRLSTIANASRIYVLEGGRVVQHGTFAELSGQDGPFKRLMAQETA